MAKYRVLKKSSIFLNNVTGAVIRTPGDIVELPDDAETHDNLERVDPALPVTPLHGEGQATTPTHLDAPIKAHGHEGHTHPSPSQASWEKTKPLLPEQAGLL